MIALPPAKLDAPSLSVTALSRRGSALARLSARMRRRHDFPLFAAKRLLKAFFVYVICIMAIAAVLNSVLQATAEGQIVESVNAAMSTMSRATMKGSPAEVRAAMIAEQRKAYGLDRPFAIRIFLRTWDIVSLGLGDLGGPRGSSGMQARIGVALGNSFILLGISTLAALAIGICLGIRMANKPGGRLDRVSTASAMLFFGTPTWWVATIFLYFLVYEHRIFPFGMAISAPPPEGFLPRLLDRASYLVLPVLSIGFIRTWGVAYMARSILLPPLQEDYIMAARGRGIGERRVIFGHALASAMPGIATSSIQLVVASLGGDIVVEKIFAYPGIGFLFWESVRLNRVAQAISCLAVLTAMTCLAYAFLDIAYSFMDPRIRRPVGRGTRLR